MPASSGATTVIRMDGKRVPAAGLAMLIAVVLVGGMALGSAVTAIRDTTPAPSSTAQADPTAEASVAALPDADMAGEDVARLPRFPGSVRTEYAVTMEGDYRFVAIEYFTDAPIEQVRVYFQRMIDDHGWERADIQYSGGEWTYVLVDGSTEALVEIEMTRGLVEIDLQVSEPLSTPTPVPTPAPPPVETPAPTPPPVVPAPQPPAGGGGDDDDGDDDADDGGDDDDGASDG